MGRLCPLRSLQDHVAVAAARRSTVFYMAARLLWKDMD